MSCCRRGLTQTTGPAWPALPASTSPTIQAAPVGPCYFIDLQGDFLGLRVVDGVVYVVSGSESHEARQVLRSCPSPQARKVEAVVERAYLNNTVAQLVAMMGSRTFTFHFLRSQLSP